ncbi:MAG: hypothetical protein R3B13_41440 [Polyangiaceae bacterium]
MISIRTLVVVSITLGGCAPARSASDMQSDNPLGPSFWLIPAPSTDDGLIGRRFRAPPDTALSLEEQSEANPCAEHLATAATAEMPNQYENAIDVKTTANAGMLGLFGFSADASHATHLLYKVTTSEKLTRLDTAEYVACCKREECGWGYVSALIRGEGEYVSAQQTELSASGNYTVYSGGASHAFRALTRRRIHGYLAAVIVAHDRSQSVQACPPGHEWAKIECVEKGEIEAQRAKCSGKRSSALELLDVREVDDYVRTNACDWLDAHGQSRVPQ